MEVAFYQLTTTSLEKTLPKLLEKAYASNQRAVVLVDSQERLEFLNSVFWTYSTNAFLPHGSAADAPETHSRQPIWLTTKIENPNKASLIISTSGTLIDVSSGFSRCLDVFDGNIPEFLTEANKRFNHYQELGIDCVYWRQNMQGGWESVSKVA
ncbi:MAG: DNA polymerase III subunit chi [Alphaproteobacteria bacterium]|nr:DNA polymerase III subunit chi [Alphaproteobacteria bacterium]